MASFLACRLETGRTHQIRVHLASIGHPLMGDEVYGAGFRTKIGAFAAKSARPPWQPLAGRRSIPIYSSLKHPSSGKILRFQSELPPDLARLHDALVESCQGTSSNGDK